jgi:hypothetical protein
LQLALIGACDVMIGPHSGLLMAASTVGTPCLYLSGVFYPEYFFNPGVPFYSVFPDSRFPAYPKDRSELVILGEDSDGDGPRALAMSAARISEDLPEIVYAAAGLVAKRWSYNDAMYHHFRRLVDVYGGETSRVSSFGATHARYLDDLFIHKRPFTLPPLASS